MKDFYGDEDNGYLELTIRVMDIDLRGWGRVAWVLRLAWRR